MTTFTTPVVAEVPPVSVADSRQAAPTVTANRFGERLFRYYASRDRGVAVFKMSDGTYRIARPVTGLDVTVLEPWPPVPEGQVVNDAVAWSFYNDQGTEYPLEQPTVALVYYGGCSYQVSPSEAASLTAAGFGAYLS